MRNTIAGFLSRGLPYFSWSPGALGLCVVCLLVLGSGHVILAKGDLPQLFPGFVPRDEFEMVQVGIEHINGKFDETTRARIRGELRTEVRRYCQAITRGGMVDIYDEQIEELQEEYQDVNGGLRFVLNRNCEEIGAG